MLRCNARQPIFLSDEDRSLMCLLLQEGTERFGYFIHSFCFMSNHIHLAIEVRETSISRIIQNLAFRYTRYINKKYDRVGHLFQGRFKSIVVDGNKYLKELIRYIHLNPVRAGLVDRPEKYTWSSHRAYLTLNSYTWVTYDKLLKNFSQFRNESINHYEDFILKGIGIEPMDFKSGSSDGILGDEEFISDFLETVERPQPQKIQLSDIVMKICTQFKLSDALLRAPGKHREASHARAVLSLFVRESKNLSIEELALFLNRDPSGLGKLASRLEKKCAVSQSLATEINTLRHSIFYSIQMSECPA
ncbi:MAG: transposase [Simkaniaceae bacterium]|nr:transposase [Simkaniaceae bacterium]